jgi:hypothetical protein
MKPRKHKWFTNVASILLECALQHIHKSVMDVLSPEQNYDNEIRTIRSKLHRQYKNM